jgi:hypothetical protein
MKCTDVRAALPLLIYGEPSPQDAALREHVAACPACRRECEALSGVRRLLDDAAVPRIAVDLPQIHRTLAERQMRRVRRWRRTAVAFGALAAVLLLALGLRLEFRLEASQLIVRWGDPPVDGLAGGTGVPPVAGLDRRPAGPTTPPGNIEAELRVLSDLIHALKQDADERDQLCADRLDRLEKHVRALQSQSDQRWSATEESVAALYLLSRKGEKP